jgi:hypothetical protein
VAAHSSPPPLQRALVSLLHRFLSLPLGALCALGPYAAHLRGSHLHRSLWLLIRSLPSPARAYRVVASCPSPHRQPRRVPSLPVPLTYVAVTCVARSLTVHLSPIVIGHADDPTTTAGAHVPWCLRSSPPSQGHPLAWAVLVELARCGSPPAPTLMAGIDWPGLLSPMLHVYYRCSDPRGS